MVNPFTKALPVITSALKVSKQKVRRYKDLKSCFEVCPMIVEDKPLVATVSTGSLSDCRQGLEMHFLLLYRNHQ